MKKITWQQLSVIIVTLAVIVVNALANILPINGQTTGEVSDRFLVYFVPAGYVFSIWGLIYLALVAYTVYQALPAQRDNATLQRIAPFYLVANLANIAWIFLWHYEQFPLTLIAMGIILVSLVVIYLLARAHEKASPSRNFRWFGRMPFSLYLGWISVATVANISQTLNYVGWNGWGIAPQVWTLIMLVIAAGIAVAMMLTQGDVVYNLVFIWAYLGIAFKHSEAPLVSTPAVMLAAVLGVLIVLRLVNVLRPLSQKR